MKSGIQGCHRKKTKYPYYECMNGMEREALIHMDL